MLGFRAKNVVMGANFASLNVKSIKKLKNCFSDLQKKEFSVWIQGVENFKN